MAGNTTFEMSVDKIFTGDDAGPADLQKDTAALMMETVPLITRKLSRKFAKGGFGHGPLPPLLTYALMIIGEQGPISMGTLARSMQVPKQNATITVDRLVAYGYVERQPHPRDRRMVTVSLNGKGREQIASMQMQMSSRIGEFLDSLSTEQAKELHNAILALNTFFKKL
jgi:DNA-binding MarR family transcriptional regulator